MNVYMTEEEQVEQIKKWWNKYGNMLVTVLLVIIIAAQGYRWYENRQLTVKESASKAFNGLMNSIAKKDTKAIQSQANFIKENYPASIYASSAVLYQAKSEVEAKQYKKAQENLNWVIANAKSNTFKQLAQLRLARIYLFQKEYGKAVAALNIIDEPLYASLIHEVKGDIYLAQNKKKQANEAYRLALSSLPSAALASSDLRIKISNTSDIQSQLVTQAIKNQQPLG